MSSFMAPILGEIDQRVVIGFIVITCIAGILSFIKKAVKIGIVSLAIAICASGIIPVAKEFQQNYQFKIDNGVATIRVKGNDYKLDKESIKNIKLQNSGFNGYEADIVFEDSTMHFIIPTFMVSNVRGFAEKNNINISVLE